jgi:hypothetical protein
LGYGRYVLFEVLKEKIAPELLVVLYDDIHFAVPAFNKRDENKQIAFGDKLRKAFKEIGQFEIIKGKINI